MKFNEFKEIVNKIKDESQKNDFVLNAVFDAQSRDIVYRNNVFIGTLTSNNERGDHWFVSNLKTIAGDAITKYPYEYENSRYPFSAHCKSELVNSIAKVGSTVIISVVRGNLNKENEALEVKTIRSLASLNLSRNSSTYDIYNAILEEAAFIDERDKIKSDFINWFRIPHLKAVADSLTDTIQNLQREKKQYEEVLSPLRNEHSQLSKKIEGMRQQESDINRLTQEKAKLEEAVNNLDQQKVNLTKEVSRLQEQEKSLAAKELEVEQKKRRIRFFLNLDESDDYPTDILQFNEESPVDVLKKRLDFPYPDSILIPFLSALSTTQIITLFGKPGTGKTTFVTKMAKALGAKCSIISVQNNWTDSSDLLGYYNSINKTYESTPFLDALLCAYREWTKNGSNSRLHIICLDEMNLARVEYYFASFLSLLQMKEEDRWINPLPKHIEDEITPLYEKKRQQLGLTDNDKSIIYLEKADVGEKEYLYSLSEYMSFKLPPNVRFVGTINHDDTTNSLSPKVKDRSFFIELTAENYSKDKQLQNINGYYPLSFFDVTEEPEEEIVDPKNGFFKDENGRLKKYASMMLRMYRDRLSISEPKNLFAQIVIGKLLPAAERKKDVEEIKTKYGSLSGVTVAIDTRATDDYGDSFDYLGG